MLDKLLMQWQATAVQTRVDLFVSSLQVEVSHTLLIQRSAAAELSAPSGRWTDLYSMRHDMEVPPAVRPPYLHVLYCFSVPVKLEVVHATIPAGAHEPGYLCFWVSIGRYSGQDATHLPAQVTATLHDSGLFYPAKREQWEKSRY